MTSTRSVLSILAAWLLTTGIQAISGAVLLADEPTSSGAAPWVLLSNFCVVLVVHWFVRGSPWRGLRLAFLVFIIPWLVSALNLIEGAFFLTHSDIPWAKLHVHQVAIYGLSAPIWVALFRASSHDQSKAEIPTLMPRKWLRKLVVLTFAYVFLYLAAGLLIYPFVADFYATQTIPPLSTMVALQLLLRGPAYSMICLALARTHTRSWAGVTICTGVALAVLNGVAPLIVPTPHFPDAVRWTHCAEVTASNFLFGFLAGWLWTRDEPLISTQTAKHQILRPHTNP